MFLKRLLQVERTILLRNQVRIDVRDLMQSRPPVPYKRLHFSRFKLTSHQLKWLACPTDDYCSNGSLEVLCCPLFPSISGRRGVSPGCGVGARASLFNGKSGIQFTFIRRKWIKILICQIFLVTRPPFPLFIIPK